MTQWKTPRRLPEDTQNTILGKALTGGYRSDRFWPINILRALIAVWSTVELAWWKKLFVLPLYLAFAAWTTPSTRSTGDLITAAIWNQDMVDNVQYLHDRVGVIWQAPTVNTTGGSATSNVGDWLYGIVQETAFNTAYLNMVVPDDFDSLVSLEMIVAANAAGTVYWTLTSDYGTDGEALTNHSGALSNQAWAAVTTYTAIDISGAFAVLAAGDYLGAKVTKGSSAWVTTNSMYVLGWRMVYNRQ